MVDSVVRVKESVLVCNSDKGLVVSFHSGEERSMSALGAEELESLREALLGDLRALQLSAGLMVAVSYWKAV